MLLACLLLTHFLGLQFSDLVILNIAMRGAAQTQVQSCILSSKSGFLLVLVKTWKLSILSFDTTPYLRKWSDLLQFQTHRMCNVVMYLIILFEACKRVKYASHICHSIWFNVILRQQCYWKNCIASPAGRTPSVELKSDIWCSGSCLWSFSWDLKSFQYYFVFLQHNNQSRATPAHTAHQRVRVTLDSGKHEQSRHNNLCVTTNPIRTPDAMCSCSSVGAPARGNWREGWECDVAINTVGGGNGWTYLSAARPTQLSPVL